MADLIVMTTCPILRASLDRDDANGSLCLLLRVRRLRLHLEAEVGRLLRLLFYGDKRCPFVQDATECPDCRIGVPLSRPTDV